MYSLVSCLLLTYGVVERIRNMLRSVAVEEFEEMEKIWSDLHAAYPIIYPKLTLEDEEEDEDEKKYKKFDRSRRIAGCLRSLRTSAYDIEDMLDVAATDHLSLKVYGIRATAPHKSIGDLADSITQLRRSLSQLLEICDTVEQARTAEYKPAFVIHPLDAASLSSITNVTGASSRYYRGLWSLPEDAIVGRESEKERIMHWVSNNDDDQHPNVVAIRGEAGKGKTTLAKMIYNDAVRVSASFDLVSRALAHPWHADLKSTLVEIIRSFTNQSRHYLQRMDTETLKQTLRGILAGQKYLLVLDDHDGRGLEWEELREIFEVGSAGSTVILIESQWRQQVHTTKRLELLGLHQNDGRSLFAQCAGFDEEAEQEYPFMRSIGRSLVDKCDGFPLAIKTLGSMLRTNRDEHSWKQIKESKIWNRSTSYESDTATTAFKISLEHMSPDLLQCLHVSSILSKYKVMSRDQLMFSWMALGLLHSRDGNEDPIDIGNRYCDELVFRCFVQLFQSDGHHMVLLQNQALSFYVLREEVAFVSADAFSPGICRFLIWIVDESLLDKSFAPDNSTLPSVRTFLFQKYVGPVSKLFLEGLISKLKRARVMLLDGAEFEELPEAIGNLKLLRYLSLAGNHTLNGLPDSICNLSNLQTLDLSGCEQLQTLPENMHNLVSLRHLFLSLNLTNVPERALKSWTSLRHLKICNCPNLNSLSEGISHLTALEVLQIHDCPSIASLPNSIKCLTSLNEISILNCAMLDLTNWEGLVGFRGLQFLQIQDLPKLSRFPLGLESDSLRHLVVSNCQGLTVLPECLQECINLVEMVIENCPNLATLPKGIHEIKTLQVLKIVNCPKLIARCQRGVGDDWHLISHIPKIQLIQHQGYLKRAISALPDKVPHSKESLVLSRRTPNRFKSVVNALTTKSVSRMSMSLARDPRPTSLLSPFSEHSSRDEDKDPMHHDPEIRVLYPIIQTKVTTSFPVASTSTLNEHPGAISLEQSLDKQETEVEVEKQIEWSKAGAIFQEAPKDLPKVADEEVVREARMMEEMKDHLSILFLLPEDYEIEKDTLIQLWMAAEHVKDEPHGEECFSVVLDEGYLLRCGTNFMTGKDRYRINTQKINELLLLGSLKDNASYYLRWRKECQNNPESIQHVSLDCSTEIDATTFQTLEKFNQLRTLLFLGNHGRRVTQMPSHLFSRFNKLHALDLSRTHMKELPSSIGHMIHLRYLDLSWTLIERLPDILCSLDQLQTVKLIGCLNLRKLPGQLYKLTKLRRLDLDVLRQLKTMPRGIGALVNLRTLSAFLVGTEDGCKIQELKELNNLSGNFCIAKLEHVDDADEAKQAALYKKEHIDKLELRWTASELSSRKHNKSDPVLERLQPCTSLEELRILCYQGSKFPCWISNPEFSKLVSITFYRCENVSELPLLEQLPLLKYLDLIKMNSITIIERRANLENDIAFFRLEKLEIDEMQSLKTWRWGSSNEDDFRSLVELTISGCPELRELDLLPHLSAIKRLEIRECPKLKSSSDTKLPDSLEELIVEDCPHIDPKEMLRADGRSFT